MRRRQRTYTISEAAEASCLVSGDLDNDARITCLWTKKGAPSPARPGIEAYFPTAAWRH